MGDAPHELEHSILQERAGTMPRAQLLALLLRTQLVVPSKVAAGDELSLIKPLLLDNKLRQSFLAVFTEAAGAAAYRYLAPYIVTATGRALLHEVPDGMGIVLNPGADTLLELAPDEVNALRSARRDKTA